MGGGAGENRGKPLRRRAYKGLRRARPALPWRPPATRGPDDPARSDPLFRRADPLDPRTGPDDRAGRRLVELEPAQLLRDEVGPAYDLIPSCPLLRGFVWL